MKWIMSILTALPLLCLGQGNLVPNGGFEELWTCPSGSNQVDLAAPWMNDIGGCEVYNECVEPTFIPPDHYQYRQGVPENSVGYQSAHSGEGYAGIFTYGGPFEVDGREYLQIRLTEPLQPSKYIVSFWASLADKYQYSITSLGAYLSDTLVTRTSFNSVLDFEPSVENAPTQNLSNKDIWYLVRDTFTSRYGGEEYLLVGNFRITEESNLFWVDSGAGNNWDRSYYYIDDVSVIALDSVSSGVGITEQEAAGFRIYPNPNNGQMTLEYNLKQDEAGQLNFYNTIGQCVLTHQLNAGTNFLQIELNGVSNGLYSAVIAVNGEIRLSEKVGVFTE